MKLKWPCRHPETNQWCWCAKNSINCTARGVKIKDRITNPSNEFNMNKNYLGYKANRQEKLQPKVFGKRNRPLNPQTKAGTSYIISPAGSGNTPDVEVSMFPKSSDILMK